MRGEQNAVREPRGVDYDSPAASKYFLEVVIPKLSLKGYRSFLGGEWGKAFQREKHRQRREGSMKYHDVFRKL